MSNHRVALTAALAVAGMLLSASTALAIEAAAKSAVNVRTGPGTGFSVVDQLTTGETVDITECAPSGWCFVEHSGPDGWVSASFLTSPDDASDEEESDGGGDNPDCGFGFNVGPDGPQLSINCGDAPPPPAPPADDEDEDAPQACFYVSANFAGNKFCMDEGTRNALNATFNDKISSVELTGGAKATLCDGPNLTGTCKIITHDTDTLPGQINNKASSLVVFTGAPPAPEPEPEPEPADVPDTFSTGGIDLKQTWSANFDNGTSGSGGEDVWYEAVTDSEKYLKPVNGGKMALGDGSNRGYAGCSTESFSSAKVALDDAPVGTYICVKTNEGRISQFRVNSFVGTTMKIGYTTWSN